MSIHFCRESPCPLCHKPEPSTYGEVRQFMITEAALKCKEANANNIATAVATTVDSVITSKAMRWFPEYIVMNEGSSTAWSYTNLQAAAEKAASLNKTYDLDSFTVEVRFITKTFNLNGDGLYGEV